MEIESFVPYDHAFSAFTRQQIIFILADLTASSCGKRGWRASLPNLFLDGAVTGPYFGVFVVFPAGREPIGDGVGGPREPFN
jgi:hypothetical protein